MSRVRCFIARRAGSAGAFAAVMFCWIAAAQAQESTAERTDASGRIDFEAAKLPPATVEVDVSQGMFSDLFGIGDAAVEGVAETLRQSAERNGGEGTRMAAEQLAAARQIMQLASEVVREVRVRVYDQDREEAGRAEDVAAQFDGQLREGNWDNVVRIRDDDAAVRVSLLRDAGTIRGVFIVAGENNDLVLANVVCDISPENVKKLTSAAAKIGLENGLQQMLEVQMREMKHRLPPPSAESKPAPAR
ncbi:MAG TPA: DUF4252 domain-containing protein [Lacipirellulaceae bacterium]|jgi:hypothetical protein|nr:DUF4252 domain-containing protein [Lacipirellulaceae bacterium]